MILKKRKMMKRTKIMKMMSLESISTNAWMKMIKMSQRKRYVCDTKYLECEYQRGGSIVNRAQKPI